MRKTSTYARKRRHMDPLAGIRVLDRARPFDEGDTTGEHIKTRACFERLADGTADNDDFDRVAMALNLAKVRAMESASEMRQFRELAALRVALKESQEIINWALEQQT